jgi:hypothetical protein
MFVPKNIAVGLKELSRILDRFVCWPPQKFRHSAGITGVTLKHGIRVLFHWSMQPQTPGCNHFQVLNINVRECHIVVQGVCVKVVVSGEIWREHDVMGKPCR